MTVLVVRPAPACFELVTMLQHAKIPALAAPLLSFAASKELFKLENTLANLPSNSIVVAVSPRAVEFAAKALEHKIWRNDLHFVAVGKKTAQTWRQLTSINAIVPTNESSEGLLKLDIFSKPKNRNILILRGNSGRDLLANELKELGAKVCYFETYLRIWDTKGVLNQSKLWQKNKVNKIIITSGEQLGFIWSSADHKTQLWLIQCQLFVPSQRIYHQAKSLGFKSVINVDYTSNQALVNALNKTNILDNYK